MSQKNGNELTDALNEHNALRKVHGSPPLKINKEMTEEANAYARELSKLGFLKNHVNGSDGENLAFGCSRDDHFTLRDATKMWYKELCHPGYSFNDKESLDTLEEPDTGHFTQLVWKDSKELGMGSYTVERDNHKCTFIVARYRPAGNYIGFYNRNVKRGSFSRDLCSNDDWIAKKRLSKENSSSKGKDLLNTFVVELIKGGNGGNKSKMKLVKESDLEKKNETQKLLKYSDFKEIGKSDRKDTVKININMPNVGANMPNLGVKVKVNKTSMVPKDKASNDTNKKVKIEDSKQRNIITISDVKNYTDEIDSLFTDKNTTSGQNPNVTSEIANGTDSDTSNKEKESFKGKATNLSTPTDSTNTTQHETEPKLLFEDKSDEDIAFNKKSTLFSKFLNNETLNDIKTSDKEFNLITPLEYKNSSLVEPDLPELLLANTESNEAMINGEIHQKTKINSFSGEKNTIKYKNDEGSLLGKKEDLGARVRNEDKFIHKKNETKAYAEAPGSVDTPIVKPKNASSQIEVVPKINGSPEEKLGGKSDDATVKETAEAGNLVPQIKVKAKGVDSPKSSDDGGEDIAVVHIEAKPDDDSPKKGDGDKGHDDTDKDHSSLTPGAEAIAGVSVPTPMDSPQDTSHESITIAADLSPIEQAIVHAAGEGAKAASIAYISGAKAGLKQGIKYSSDKEKKEKKKEDKDECDYLPADEAGLKAHNAFRKIHGVQELKLDTQLTNDAIEYAEKLAKSGKTVTRSDVNEVYGENIAHACYSEANMELSPVDAVKYWYKEACNPGYQFDLGSANTGTDRFSQVIWNSTTHLGLGVAKAKKDDEYCTYVVARYKPKGNIVREYKNNIPKGDFKEETCDPKKLDEILHCIQAHPFSGKIICTENKIETPCPAEIIKPEKPIPLEPVCLPICPPVGQCHPCNTTSTVFNNPVTVDTTVMGPQQLGTSDGTMTSTIPQAPFTPRLPCACHERPKSIFDPCTYACDAMFSKVRRTKIGTSPFRQQVLRAHNFYRQIHKAHALKLDDLLSEAAQQFAEQAAEEGGFEHFQGTASTNVESYVKKCVQPKEREPDGYKITKAWYEKVCNPGYDFKKQNVTEKTRNFAQIIWKRTRRIGVGKAYKMIGEKKCIFIVVRYSSPVVDSDIPEQISLGSYSTNTCIKDKKTGRKYLLKDFYRQNRRNNAKRFNIMKRVPRKNKLIEEDYRRLIADL